MNGLYTMLAAIQRASSTYPVTDNLAAAMGTARRQCRDGTLKTVEGMGFARHNDFKAAYIVIAAFLALRHGNLLVL
jgi:hypothetical protein